MKTGLQCYTTSCQEIEGLGTKSSVYRVQRMQKGRHLRYSATSAYLMQGTVTGMGYAMISSIV